MSEQNPTIPTAFETPGVGSGMQSAALDCATAQSTSLVGDTSGGRQPSVRRRLSVLYVHPGTELYGSDRMAAVTVRALVRDGMHLTVVVPNVGPLIKQFEEAGARVLVRQALVLRKQLLRPSLWPLLVRDTLKSLRLARRVLEKLQPDAVYVNTIVQPTWMVAARLAHIPLVCHVREAENTSPSIVRAGIVAALAAADLVIYNSVATRNFVEASSLRRISRGEVIYNGKDWSPFLDITVRSVPKEPRLVVIGRLNPRKGQHVVIEAMKELRDRGMRTSVTFVGDTFPGYEWYKEELRQHATRAGLGDSCDFAGFSSDVPRHLAEADIAIVPSFIEPFGTVAAEAMVSMRPTIAARSGGLAEIIEHEHTGLLFPPGDAHALANSIFRLASDSQLASRLATAGRESILSRFSESRYEHDICSAVRKVIDRDDDR